MRDANVLQKLKRFLNSIFNPVSDLDNDPFWNPPKTSKYAFVSIEERQHILEMLQHKYPKFRRACRINKWVELWNTMHLKDEVYKNRFLIHFEDAIKELCNEDEP